MSKVALLFPGQGSQAIGMGTALAEAFPDVRVYFEEASQILGWDVLKTCAEGPDDRLRQTDIAQPALYVTGYSTYMALRSLGVHAELAAGHSIGEYAALAAANVFSFVDGVMLVQERARLMAEAAKSRPGSMMAILGLDAGQVQALCADAKGKGVVVAVNFNSPEQTVIAGEKDALEEAGRLATERGAKRVIPLNVSGAFHSPLMDSAARRMQRMIGQTGFKKAAMPVVMNVDGRSHQQPEDIRVQLELQLDHAVQWVQTLQTLKAEGATDFVECGAGRVLTGLLRRIDRQAPAHDTDTIEAINQVGKALGASRKG